jgi:hypothetical protein
MAGIELWRAVGLQLGLQTKICAKSEANVPIHQPRLSSTLALTLASVFALTPSFAERASHGYADHSPSTEGLQQMASGVRQTRAGLAGTSA